MDRAQLEAAVGSTFANLYVLQQRRLGRTLEHDVGAVAICDKGGPTVEDQGTGEDWSCQLSWVSADGSLAQADYELQVKTDACFTASGASVAVGGPELETSSAVDSTVTNPLYEFEGCTRAM